MLETVAGLALWMAASSVDLPTLMRASERPDVCRSDVAARAAGGSTASAWQSAGDRSRRELCADLSRAHVTLHVHAAQALERALALEAKWPKRLEPVALRARALSRLGRHPEAWTLWESLRQAGHVARSPGELRERAVSAARSGHREVALKEYRRLLTLASLWPSATDRRRLYVEAAAVALGQGPDHVGEAAAYLAEARRGASSVRLRSFVAGMTALVQLFGDEKRSSLTEVEAGETWLLVERVRSPSQPEYFPEVGATARAAASLLVEPLSRLEAQELWTEYAEALAKSEPSSPWLAKVRARARRLEEDVR